MASVSESFYVVPISLLTSTPPATTKVLFTGYIVVPSAALVRRLPGWKGATLPAPISTSSFPGSRVDATAPGRRRDSS